MTRRLPVSVVVPTIGRMELLRSCLRSIGAGSALPTESVLVDQSGGDAPTRLIADLPSLPIRRIASRERNIAATYNVGIGAAREAIVAITHDDCTVAPDWLEACVRTVASRSELLATGRVIP